MKKSGQARTWIVSTATLVFSAACQLISLLILARAIGAEDYAVIVAVGAAVSIGHEIVGLGGGELVIRAMANNRGAYREYSGHAWSAVLATLPIVALGGILITLSAYAIELPVEIVIALMISELAAARCIALSEHIALAHKDALRANQARVYAAGSRLILICIACFVFGVSSIEGWWPWQFFYGLVFTPLISIAVIHVYGRPVFRLDWSKARRAAPFSATQIIRAINNNLDRFIVGAAAAAAVLGSYGVAARLAHQSLLPISALLRIAYPEFFSRGAKGGVRATLAYAFKLWAPSLAIAGCIAAALFFIGPIFVYLLGEDFAPLQEILPWFAPLPIAVVTQYLFGDSLTAADLKGRRIAVQLIGLCLTALFIWIGVSQFGAIGAAKGLVVATSSTALLMMMMAIVSARLAPPQSA
ncbi:MAG: hypothetical protein AAGM38_01480 [Pseudomonadota bacterium]